MNLDMLDEIITKKLSLWAQRGLNDSFYVSSNREAKKEKRLSKINQKVSKNISKKSINKQLRLF